ncbi:3-oxoacyl-[acyl-carrier-protein] synthase III C-terminal domain-containing protein [Paenibacillus rhizoplanae]
MHTWSTLARALGCPLDKFYASTLEDAGHLHNTDILLNVNEAVRTGSLNRGDFYLAVTIGFGGLLRLFLAQIRVTRVRR